MCNLSLVLKYVEILEISRKFKGNFRENSKKFPRKFEETSAKIRRNFSEISEIQPNTVINLYMWTISVGLKYVEILEISRKFQGNFRNSIEHNNKPVHVEPKRRSEIRGNFRNLKEISEIQSNTIINLYMWNLSVGLKYVGILEI